MTKENKTNELEKRELTLDNFESVSGGVYGDGKCWFEHDGQLFGGTELAVHDLQRTLSHGAVGEIPGEVVVDPGPGDLGNAPGGDQQQNDQDYGTIPDDGSSNPLLHGSPSLPDYVAVYPITPVCGCPLPVKNSAGQTKVPLL